MQTFSLTPLFRSTVGFDRFNDLFESLMDGEDRSDSYPPYNIEKYGEDRYGITMAVPGFSEKDLNITFHSDRVIVSGRKEENNDNDTVEYLYHGIASRGFERTFRLADHMKVTDAELKDGLLRIKLVREIPEEQKPRMIQISTGGGQKTIEHSLNNKEKKKAA
ncbi:MAG: heat-shock protein [Proteobacteria bacterium]|nr:heat-shock protein [Pseudomonadota bacterium]